VRGIISFNLASPENAPTVATETVLTATADASTGAKGQSTDDGNSRSGSSLSSSKLPAIDDTLPAQLHVYAGANKQEASSQGRHHWQEKVLPQVVEFYHSCCRGTSATEEKVLPHAQVSSSDAALSKMAGHSKSQQKLFFVICGDGLLSCTVAAALLVAFHDISSVNLTPLLHVYSSVPNLLEKQQPRTAKADVPSSPPRRHQLPCPSRSKDDVRECFAAMQLYIPLTSQVPRRLMKELNIFFSTPQQR
jgi:hypothetical protein